MTFGKIVRTADGALGIQASALNVDKQAIVVFQTSGTRKFYDAPADITEFTPEVLREAMPMLARTVYAAAPYSGGRTGTDPEVFAFTKEGKLIPAYTFLPKNSAGITVYWDGFQAEFQVTPTSCHSYLTDYVRSQLIELRKKLVAHDPTAVLRTADVVRIDQETRLTAADEHIMLGCAPSGNAYPRTKPIAISDPRSHAWRYSGCHLHYSTPALSVVKPDWFPHGTVVMMDKIAGLLLTALGRDWEDPRRRKAYGRAGEFRVPSDKECRLEYRTPGSFLMHHPALFNFACDMGRLAYRLGLTIDGRILTELAPTAKIINNCDADAAWALIDKQRAFFSDLLTNQTTYTTYNADKTLDVLRVGAKASGLFGTDLAENWRLAGDRDAWLSHNENAHANWGRLVV